jgi:hypothetical protein
MIDVLGDFVVSWRFALGLVSGIVVGVGWSLMAVETIDQWRRKLRAYLGGDS